MKLKNKRTREICELKVAVNGDLAITKDDEIIGIYSSLAELNKEWEDYEEPKEYWTIDWTCTGVTKSKYDGDDVDDFNKSIGNYFETEEEAEKAVEKLKAWKRLKDKGISFGMRRHTHSGGEMFWECPNDSGISDKQIWQDLDLLFGGEE